MKFYVLTVLIALNFALKGQIVKYSNEFLNIGVGARALGMGNTGVASTTGAYSGYWNPAGLLKQRSDLEVALMHAEYFAGIAKYDFMAAKKRIASNSVDGITILRFGVDNIPNTLELVDANGNVDYSRIKTFNAVDFACLLSYARNIPKLKDIESTSDLLQSLGSEAVFDGSKFIFNVKKANSIEAHYDCVRKIRVSILCLGPLLAKYGGAVF